MREGNYQEQEAKTKECIDLYKENGNDPWNNRETGIYNRVLKPFITELDKYLLSDVSTVYDIGAGGGNIVEALKLNSSKNLIINGTDVSEEAVTFLNTKYEGDFHVADIEDFQWNESSTMSKHLTTSDVVTFIDVIYYLGSKRYYRESVLEIWKAMKKGSILFYGDNLKRHNYRTFIKNLPGAQLLYEDTYYDEPVCEETSDTGRKWYRYFKGILIKKTLDTGEIPESMLPKSIKAVNKTSSTPSKTIKGIATPWNDEGTYPRNVLFIGPIETPNSKWYTVGDSRMLELYLQNLPKDYIVDLVAYVDNPEKLPKNIHTYYDTKGYELLVKSKYKLLCEQLKHIIPKYKTVVIHTSKIVFLINLYQYIKSEFSSIEFIYFMHNPPENLTFTYYHTDLITDMLTKFENFKLVSVSKSHMLRIKDSLHLENIPKNLICIPNGIKLHKGSFKEYCAVTVGRLDEHKASLESIKVVKAIASMTGKQGIVIGSMKTTFGRESEYTKQYLSELESELKDGVDTGLIKWYKYLPNYSVLSFMQNSDVTVTMSPIETFGLTVAESNMVGTPVIGVDSCGVGELIKPGVNGYKIDISRMRTSTKVLSVANLYEKAVELDRDSIRTYAENTFDIKESVKSLQDLIGGV